MQRLFPLILLTAACGGVSGTTADPSSIDGTVNLSQGDYQIEFVEGSNRCFGSGPFSDVSPGAVVVVTDDAGIRIGDSLLGVGARDVASFDCVFPFDVELDRVASTYLIAIGSHTGPTFTHEELSQRDWHAEVALPR